LAAIQRLVRASGSRAEIGSVVCSSWRGAAATHELQNGSKPHLFCSELTEGPFWGSRRAGGSGLTAHPPATHLPAGGGRSTSPRIDGPLLMILFGEDICWLPVLQNVARAALVCIRFPAPRTQLPSLPPLMSPCRWYDAHSDEAWGDDKPTVMETRVHAKCLRSVASVRNYFREYRAKKKHEQGRVRGRPLSPWAHKQPLASRGGRARGCLPLACGWRVVGAAVGRRAGVVGVCVPSTWGHGKPHHTARHRTSNTETL
jgi:hypothetical protein